MGGRRSDVRTCPRWEKGRGAIGSLDDLGPSPRGARFATLAGERRGSCSRRRECVALSGTSGWTGVARVRPETPFPELAQGARHTAPLSVVVVVGGPVPVAHPGGAVEPVGAAGACAADGRAVGAALLVADQRVLVMRGAVEGEPPFVLADLHRLGLADDPVAAEVEGAYIPK